MLRYTILVLALFGVACVLSSNPAEEVPTEAEQCIRLGYDGSCKTYGEYQYCEALKCARFIEGHKRARPFTADPALNGTHCLYDGICVNGECVIKKRTVTKESQARDQKYTYTCVQ